MCGGEAKSLGQHVKGHGMTPLEYYHRFVLKTDEKPCCAHCDGPVKFVDIVNGYHRFCGYSCRTKAQLAEAWKDSEYRAKQSARGRETMKRNHANQEFRKLNASASSARLRERWRDDGFRTTIASALERSRWTTKPENHERVVENLNRARQLLWSGDEDAVRRMLRAAAGRWRGLRGEYDSQKAGTVSFKSALELRAMMLMDAIDSVRTFEYEPARIAYYLEGDDLQRWFHPDFLVYMADGGVILVEVKPSFDLGSQKTKAKVAAAKEFCSRLGMSFEVWTENDLFAGGVGLWKRPRSWVRKVESVRLNEDGREG